LTPIINNTGATGSTGIQPGTLLTLGVCKNGSYPWLLAPQTQIASLTTPQQITYVGNSKVALNTEAEILTYLNNSHPQSLVVENENAIMRPFAIDNQSQSNYSAQILDYTLFNLITTNFYPF
jgi:hypothetical protein